jgi:MFS family permease
VNEPAGAEAASIRMGPLVLAPGTSRLNFLTFLFAAFAGVALTSFVSVIMPYVLNVNVGLPLAEQGTVAGDLIFYGELVLLAASGVFGAWSDRFGRRAVLVGGLLALSAGYVALGMAGSVPELIAVRVFITFGIAAVSVMLSTLQVDYPAETSRGKVAAISGMVIGLGAVMIGVVFARFPDMFVRAGYAELDASRMTMLTMTGLCIVTALVVRLGLAGGAPPQSSGKARLKQQLAAGFAAGRTNPRILLAYGAGFIGRADLVVVGTFYSLWLTQAGIESGQSADVAAKNAGAMFALVMTSALLWAPVLGWLNDRYDRTLIMAVSLLLAFAGYCVMGLFGDPQGDWLVPASILLGIGQISVTQACATLIGQESPAQLRGAIVGTFSVSGAAGILFVTSVGGRMYDGVGPEAPFILIGLLNGLLAFAALWLWRR